MDRKAIVYCYYLYVIHCRELGLPRIAHISYSFRAKQAGKTPRGKANPYLANIIAGQIRVSERSPPEDPGGAMLGSADQTVIEPHVIEPRGILQAHRGTFRWHRTINV